MNGNYSLHMFKVIILRIPYFILRDILKFITPLFRPQHLSKEILFLSYIENIYKAADYLFIRLPSTIFKYFVRTFYRCIEWYKRNFK
jgi:hypothetical protein